MSIDSKISPQARIGHNVKIGFNVRIYDNVEIGDNVTIEDFCVIGNPVASGAYSGGTLVIGPNSIIRSHSVVYEGSTFGPGLQTGHHSVIRDGTRAGTQLRIGSFSAIEGDCEIGDYCRAHGYAHIGRGSRVGSFVWIYSLVTLTNDPLPPSHLHEPVTIEDGVVIAVASTVMPGTILKRGCFITASSRPSGIVPAATVFGQGRPLCGVHVLTHLGSGLRHPWMRHFADAYPKEAHPRLAELLLLVEADSKRFVTKALRPLKHGL